jgi:peptide/nickel transport system permease protein
MLRFLATRVVQALPVLVIVSMLTFAGIEAVPGDPVHAIAGDPTSGAELTPEDIARLKAQYGLDKPLPARYFHYMERLVRGDLGRSLISHRHVNDIIGERLPVSLWLAGLTLAVSSTIGITLGVIAGLKPGSTLDLGITFVAVAGVAVPGFWLAIFLILTFSLNLDWLPASGWYDPLHHPRDAASHLVLPVIALSLAAMAAVARQTRSALLEVMRNDYIVTARAKGLHRRVVVFRHAARNALTPVVTIIGLQIPVLLGGSVLIERVFAIPGLGRLSFDATFNHDYPVLQAIALLSTVTVVTANLLVDFTYALLDPRVRLR